MRKLAPQVAQRVSAAVLAGLVLGVSEAALAGLGAAHLFLSIDEFLRYSLLACCAGVSVVLLLNRLGGLAFAVLPVELSRRAWAAGLGTAVLAWPLLGRALWLLSAGRRVQSLTMRPFVVVAVAAAAAFVLGMLAQRLVVARGSARLSVQRLLGVGLLLLAAGALAIDAFVLRRLYPALHVSLSVLACLAAASAAAFLRPTFAPRRMFVLGVVGVLLAAAAPFLLRQAAGAPNLSFAIEQSAPLSGKALVLLQRSLPRSQPMASAVSPLPTVASGPLALPTHRGIDLRGRDVLVITIDALRADRLKAYGGRSNVTPVLDALASESVVFTRAYTQTPHTSYAIGSLLTGKYLRPVLSLPQAPREHTTLPRLLRRYGYRTAGFYPPAVFFVDEERFSALSEDHFGFEYVKEMFAKAPERVSQLEDYMAQADPKHSVLAWVHLFEPHEPYERHAEHDRGEEPEQRYDSEVLASDAAVADLIRVFRAKRPNATVIVSADHGEEFGDHGGYHHGTTLFEEQVRVPLLWSSPPVLLPAPVLTSLSKATPDTRLRAAEIVVPVKLPSMSAETISELFSAVLC